MNNNSLSGVLGVYLGAQLLPRFLNKKRIKEWHIDPYKRSEAKKIRIQDRTISTIVSGFLLISGLVISPFAILLSYPTLQSWFQPENMLVFQNNGQYLSVLIGLFTFPILMLAIALLLINLIPSWRRYYASSELENSFILAGILSPIQDRKERLKRLNTLAEAYDVDKLSHATLRRTILAAVVVFTLALPFYAVSLHSSVGVNEKGIRVTPIWSLSTEEYTWSELEKIKIGVEESKEGHLEPHFDLIFENGQTINIWNITMPGTRTEALLKVIEQADENNVFIEKTSPGIKLTPLRESIQEQIQTILNSD